MEHRRHYRTAIFTALAAATTVFPAAAQIGLGPWVSGLTDNMGAHVFYAGTADQHVHHLYNNGNGWVSQDLTTQAHTATLVYSNNPNILSFSDSVGEHVFYFDTADNINQLFWSSTSGWVNQNLTTLYGGHTPMQASSTDGTAGTLAGFADNMGEHVFYIDSQCHLNHLYWNSGSGWQNQDLTASIPGNPMATTTESGFSAFSDSAGEHLVYVNPWGHVSQLFWNATIGWTYQDLYSLIPASQYPEWAGVGSLASYSDSLGEHVFFIDINGKVDQFYYPWAGPGPWQFQDLTGAAPNTFYSLTAFVDHTGEHVFLTDKFGNVDQLFYSWGGVYQGWPDSSWIYQSNLGMNVCGASASLNDASGEHVFFINSAANGDIAQILFNGSWVQTTIGGPGVSNCLARNGAG